MCVCRYLDRYEKVHFLGEEADRGSDDDEESRHKRWSARALHAVPLNYNYHQHNIAGKLHIYNFIHSGYSKVIDLRSMNMYVHYYVFSLYHENVFLATNISF